MPMRIYIIIFLALSYLRVDAQKEQFQIEPDRLDYSIEKQEIEELLEIYTFSFNMQDINKPIRIKWKFPANDMHTLWTINFTGSIGPHWDFEGEEGNDNVEATSSATIEAPITALIGNDNSNSYTFAASDALNSLGLSSGVKEEDGFIYNELAIDKNAFTNRDSYTIQLRVDKRKIPYWEVLKDVSEWWASLENYIPLDVPEIAKLPMYSTWYSFHQNLVVEEVIEECRIAKSLGCKAVIVDDGWQTNNSKRGYKYTGDWMPKRIPEMKAFVDSIHAIGMKFLLWYSVPFMGTGAEAYEEFKDKFLTEEEFLGSYTLDPRYPEVREYLIGIYAKALKDWELDGFKLDFVDVFRNEEAMKPYNPKEMDYANVNEATDRLLTDIATTLKSIKSDVLIEFRQAYNGPLMRKYGNMFRVGDCAYSIADNRNGVAQIRLLAGNTATHSDMIMWHPEEPVEIAAQQLLHVMFSVPQISVRLDKIPSEHSEMLKFWLSFWIKHRDALLEGDFEAHSPIMSYPILIGKTDNKLVAGVYTPNLVVPVENKKTSFSEIYIINGSGTNHIYINPKQKAENYSYEVYDCLGNSISNGNLLLDGLKQINVPNAGLLKLVRK